MSGDDSGRLAEMTRAGLAAAVRALLALVLAPDRAGPRPAQDPAQDPVGPRPAQDPARDPNVDN
jgi:hypothetical protein